MERYLNISSTGHLPQITQLVPKYSLSLIKKINLITVFLWSQ
jgi:hypothetical protein